MHPVHRTYAPLGRLPTGILAIAAAISPPLFAARMSCSVGIQSKKRASECPYFPERVRTACEKDRLSSFPDHGQARSSSPDPAHTHVDALATLSAFERGRLEVAPFRARRQVHLRRSIIHLVQEAPGTQSPPRPE